MQAKELIGYWISWWLYFSVNIWIDTWGLIIIHKCWCSMMCFCSYCNVCVHNTSVSSQDLGRGNYKNGKPKSNWGLMNSPDDGFLLQRLSLIWKHCCAGNGLWWAGFARSPYCVSPLMLQDLWSEAKMWPSRRVIVWIPPVFTTLVSIATEISENPKKNSWSHNAVL